MCVCVLEAKKLLGVLSPVCHQLTEAVSVWVPGALSPCKTYKS